MSQQIDSRLLQRYSEVQLVNLQQDNPDEYALLDYALDNAVYYAEVPAEKQIDVQEISLPNGEATFINLGLNIEEENQYFKIAGENRLLIVKSRWVLNHEMNKK